MCLRTYQEDTVRLSVLQLIYKLVIDFGPVLKMDRENVSTRSVNKGVLNGQTYTSILF